MKQFLMNKFEKILNAYINLDPESKIILQELEGKVVDLQLTGIDIFLQLNFANHKISISDKSHWVADAKVTGSPIRLLQMSLSKNRKAFFDDDVAMEGNVNVAKKLIYLFDHLDIDWEEQISKFTGDILARQMRDFVRNIQDAIKKTEGVLTENVDEFLHEEMNIAPTAEALNDFFSEVDELRMRVDRLEARLCGR